VFDIANENCKTKRPIKMLGFTVMYPCVPVVPKRYNFRSQAHENVHCYKIAVCTYHKTHQSLIYRANSAALTSAACGQFVMWIIFIRHSHFRIMTPENPTRLYLYSVVTCHAVSLSFVTASVLGCGDSHRLSIDCEWWLWSCEVNWIKLMLFDRR
jgi:hypothetical protein